MIDEETGSEAPATASAFELIGGEPQVRALVQRFYGLMHEDPAYAGIRAMHPPTLEGSGDKLFWFLCGWLGGPQHYVQRFGHPRLRARHLPFSIGIAERDQWLDCMKRAMRDSSLDAELAQRLEASFFGTADWMRNRRA